MAEEEKVVDESTEETQVETEETKEENIFKPIESQDVLDNIIKDRLSRERKKAAETSAEFQKKLEESIAENEKLKAESEKNQKLAKENEDLKAQVKKYETDSVKKRISLQMGLPVDFAMEMASRLKGETEEEIKADAEVFVKSLPQFKKSAPQKSTERVFADSNDDVKTINDKGGLMDMLSQINETRK